MSSIHVLKFGGTSLKDATFINQAADIITERKTKVEPIVVVSAVAGVTEQLLGITKYSSREAEKVSQIIDNLKAKHLNFLDRVGTHDAARWFDLEQLFDALEAAFNDRKKRNQTPEAWRDEILSFGERASVRLMEAALDARDIKATQVESQHMITTDATFGEANVLARETGQQIKHALNQTSAIPVITGFIGSTSDGHITTLGRSGSDYTASLVAGAVCADMLEIWTDVDGVLTADPKIVPAAQSIERLSYDDITELSAHGARVIHPKTIEPLRHCEIPVKVRNSLNPDHPGTKIKKTFNSNGHFQSVTVTGPFTQLEIPGDVTHLFEHWMGNHTERFQADRVGSFRASAAEPAQYLIPGPLFDKLQQKLSLWLEKQEFDADITSDLYLVKKFTNDLLKRDDIISSVIQTLDRKNIHPVQWRRGPNRRHLSLLLPEDEARRAAVLINDITAGNSQTISIFVAGTGAVGGTLIKQIENLDHPEVHLQLLGACDTKNVKWFEPEGVENNISSTHWPTIIKRLESGYRPTIFVDATGSEEVARLYPSIFNAGIHIVTPSKLANTFEQTFYDKLRDTADKNDVHFRYETTVGAGLPVISTINNLQQSGDHITDISGVVSGTMTYLFDQLENGVPFSEAIIDAREQGYAEPDPRDDLSGEDVARKFLTLARETGLKMERSDLKVQSLIPEKLASVDKKTFLESLSSVDDYWTKKLVQAHQNEMTLRYVGQLADDKITIGVREVPVNSPLGQLKGTDNLFRIYSQRYDQTPLIIQGPGAGKEVTAAGVLGDVLEVAADIR